MTTAPTPTTPPTASSTGAAAAHGPPGPRPSGSSGRTAVICPMAIEFDAVRRAFLHAGVHPDRDPTLALRRSGIGKQAIVAAVEALALQAAPPSLVILAGACGALRPVDDVPGIARVIDEHGHEWSAGLGMVASGRTLVAVDRVVSTPADKRALADQTGACIVDMESHAFAAACERLDLPWAVVRGVSDTPDETLPVEVLNWIAPDGRTRAARAVLDMALKPRLIPHIAAVLKRSRRVLPKVGQRVVEIHQLWLTRGRAGGARA